MPNEPKTKSLVRLRFLRGISRCRVRCHRHTPNGPLGIHFRWKNGRDKGFTVNVLTINWKIHFHKTYAGVDPLAVNFWIRHRKTVECVGRPKCRSTLLCMVWAQKKLWRCGDRTRGLSHAKRTLYRGELHPLTDIQYGSHEASKLYKDASFCSGNLHKPKYRSGSNCNTTYFLTVADPGFPFGGADLRRGCFSAETCENERIGSHGGGAGAACRRCPPGTATVY